ncbi:tetratricopeptide repeat-containing sensor histidine kinase [Maribellus maritimus]|uniref:tetratricopeptide repeat-containing sensor histidine kinase n=1 Tax=Maribellus maritimus TaxID=2870838 RepID=UPI001EEB0006|nr:ATP-binding protein [Maribellus maritimus]MCG6190810.1 tetratricopeptide repeat-containing sensor histidine kinase [Maribellus maritimus]
MDKIKFVLVFVLTSLLNNLVFGQNFPENIERQTDGMSALEKVQYLGDLCWALNEKSNDEAVRYGQYALHIADSLHFYNEIARISNYLGVAMLYYQYDIKKAWIYFRQALDFGIMSNDSSIVAYAYDNIGYMYYLHRNLPSAMEYAKEALGIFESLGEQRGMAYVNTTVGLILNEQKEHQEALDYFDIALKKHVAMENLAGQAAVHFCRGNAYLDLRNNEAAQKEFEKQIEVATKAGNDKYIAEGLKGVADVFFYNQNYREALEKLDVALDINKTKNDYFGLIESRIKKALILGKLGKMNEGEEQLNMAYEVARKLGLPQKIFDIYKAYSEFYSYPGYSGNPKDIFGNLFVVYDSLYAEYEREKLLNDEQRIEIARSLEQLKTELTHQQKERKFFYIVTFLLACVGLILYWRYHTARKLTYQLEKSNNKLNKEIRKKNEVLVALKISEKGLLESNQTKSRFFSIIAHDLKGPFNSILGFVNLLKKEHRSAGEPEREEYIKYLDESTHQVYDLLENLLFWAGTQTQKIKFSPERIPVEKVVDESISLYREAAKEKEIEIVINVDSNTEIYADLNMFKTVVRNLISNAIKYTNQNGRITLDTSFEKRENSKVFFFSITDDGLGIAPERLQNLFSSEPVESIAGTNDEKGTGLGLMLCKDLVKIHGGEIWCESELNKGSRFTFFIPVEF